MATRKANAPQGVKPALKKGLWPFMLVRLADNRWYLNKAKKHSRADEAKDIGEATW